MLFSYIDRCQLERALSDHSLGYTGGLFRILCDALLIESLGYGDN